MFRNTSYQPKFRYYQQRQLIHFDARTFAALLLSFGLCVGGFIIGISLNYIKLTPPASQSNQKPKMAQTLQLIETFVQEEELIPIKPEIEEAHSLPTPKETNSKTTTELPRDTLVKPAVKEIKPIKQREEVKPKPTPPAEETPQAKTNTNSIDTATTSGAGGVTAPSSEPLVVSASSDTAESEEHIFYRKILESMISEKLIHYKASFPDKWKPVAGSYIVEVTLVEGEKPEITCITPSQNFYFNQVSEVIIKGLKYPSLKKYALNSYHQIFIFTYRPYGSRSEQ